MILPLAALVLAAALDPPAHVDAIRITPNTAVRVNGDLGEELWQTAPAVDAFVQREPEEGGQPSQRTEFRVAYDDTTLFVSVHAFDTEPDRIVSYLTRRDDDSPSDWIRVHHRLVSRPAHGVRVRGQPRRREGGSLLVQRQQRDDSWDAVWDVSVSRDARRLARRVPHPVLAAALQSVGRTTFGFAVVAPDRPAERDRHVAAALEERERLRVVVRRARRPDDARSRRSGSSWCPTPSASPSGSRPSRQSAARRRDQEGLGGRST